MYKLSLIPSIMKDKGYKNHSPLCQRSKLLPVAPLTRLASKDLDSSMKPKIKFWIISASKKQDHIQGCWSHVVFVEIRMWTTHSFFAILYATCRIWLLSSISIVINMVPLNSPLRWARLITRSQRQVLLNSLSYMTIKTS